MCDLTINKPLNTISGAQINEMSTTELQKAIEQGSPNYLTLQAMACELANRCYQFEQSQAA